MTYEWRYKEMKIKPEIMSAEETKEISTPQGMRDRMHRCVPYNTLMAIVMRQAQQMELNQFDTMTMLAFHALASAEKSDERLMEYLHNSGTPTAVILPGHEFVKDGKP